MEKAKHIFKGKLLNIYTKRARLPNGYVVNLELVSHPGAVLVIPFISKDRVIILRQFRPVVGLYLYELPAGTLERGECGADCARRELIEETGYSAQRLISLGHILPVPGYSTERISIYKAAGLRRTHRTRQKDEIIRKVIVTRQKVKRLFKEGHMVDAKTICGFTFCNWL